MRKHLAAVAMLLLLCGGMGSSALLSRAFAQSQHLSAVQEEKRIGPKPTPLWYQRWVQWRLGEGYAKGHALKPRLRPKRAPQPVPRWAWRRLHFFLLARLQRVPAAQKERRGHKPPSRTTTTSGTTTSSTTTSSTTTSGTTTSSTTTTTTTTPPPPTSTIKGYYDQGADNLTDWNAYRSNGFNLVFAPVGDTTLLSGLKSDGATAWVQPNIWTGCGYEYSTSQALSYAKTAVATGAVSGFYVADEPSTSGCSTAPSQIASWTATLHSNFPGIPTIIAAYSSSELTAFAHSADEFALDTYPCQYGNGCNYSWITQLAAAADNLGLKYVGVAQAFGGDSAGHYDLPTASQMQQILDAWKATNELGYVVYAFSAEGMPSSKWLQNDPGLLSTIAGN